MTKLNVAVLVNSLYFDEPEYKDRIDRVTQSLEKYFVVHFIKTRENKDIFDSISVGERVRMFNEASGTSNVLLSHAGGFNSIELLSRFDELRFHRKTVFVGSSDGTILANSLISQVAEKSIYGPDFMKMVFDIDSVEVMAQSIYAAVSKDYATLSRLISTSKTKVITQGEISGAKIYGGNNYTFDLLQGTKFMPKLNEPFVLLLEGEYSGVVNQKEIFPDFIRNIDSILLQPSASENIKGLLIGEFPNSISIPRAKFLKFLHDRPVLKDIPFAYDLPIGHSKGALCIPLGVALDIKLSKNNTITISEPQPT